jgi:ACS family pantothenate transporter-like MFS transporter
MQLPSNILLSNMRPSKYLPTLELIWCLLTIAMSCVQSVQNVYFIRFLLGLAEAGFYPGVSYFLPLLLYYEVDHCYYFRLYF